MAHETEKKKSVDWIIQSDEQEGKPRGRTTGRQLGDGEHNKPSVSSEALIHMIRQRPCLWNKTLPEYKDRAARDAAWTEIYREVVPDFDNCRNTVKKQIGIHITKKWCNLRDAYVKARHNYRSNKCSKPYIHTKLLSFIDPFIRERSDISQERLDSDDEGTENWYNETVYLEEDEPMPKRPKEEEIEKEDSLNLQMDENVVTLLTRMIQREDDEDRAFFKSIEPSVKLLSEDSKLEFRISVLKLIKDLKFRDRTGIQVNLKMSVDVD
ncbi:uncharacterized protein [Epargyreus clarus]|uniref:uncharacterized protein isoform X2 n=1 Tax=Epargyreus clarus TaxID=520877 RepID=UPI003C2FB8CA